MKKVLASLLALSAVLALASCGEEATGTSSATSTPTLNSIVSTPVSSIPEVSIPSIVVPEVPEAPTNLALDGATFDCGVAVYGETNTSNLIIDGLNNTGYQPAKWNEGDYCGVTLTEAADIGSLVLQWESSAYTDTFEKGGYEIYYLTPETEDEWVEIEDCEVARVEGGEGTNLVTDTVVLAETVNAQGIKIVFKAGEITDHKYAPKLWELEIYAPEETEEEPAESGAEAESEAESETAAE